MALVGAVMAMVGAVMALVYNEALKNIHLGGSSVQSYQNNVWI